MAIKIPSMFGWYIISTIMEFPDWDLELKMIVLPRLLLVAHRQFFNVSREEDNVIQTNAAE